MILSIRRHSSGEDDNLGLLVGGAVQLELLVGGAVHLDYCNNSGVII